MDLWAIGAIKTMLLMFLAILLPPFAVFMRAFIDKEKGGCWHFCEDPKEDNEEEVEWSRFYLLACTGLTLLGWLPGPSSIARVLPLCLCSF